MEATFELYTPHDVRSDDAYRVVSPRKKRLKLILSSLPSPSPYLLVPLHPPPTDTTNTTATAPTTSHTTWGLTMLQTTVSSVAIKFRGQDHHRVTRHVLLRTLRDLPQIPNTIIGKWPKKKTIFLPPLGYKTTTILLLKH